MPVLQGQQSVVPGSSAFNDSYGILLPCMHHDNCQLIVPIDIVIFYGTGNAVKGELSP
jgi:hypothetical protein